MTFYVSCLNMLLNKDKNKNDKCYVRDDTMLLLFQDHHKSVFYKKFIVSVMAAFFIGLFIGVFVLPAFELNETINTEKTEITNAEDTHEKLDISHETDLHGADRKISLAISIINFSTSTEYSSVSFITDQQKTKNRARKTKKKTKNNSVSVSKPVLYLKSDKEAGKLDYNARILIEQNNEQRLNKSFYDKKINFDRKNEELLLSVLNGVFWGPIVEKHVPIGFDRESLQNWKTYLDSNTTKIIKIERGCGRMQNRLVTFKDGVKACVRYRINTDQVQGELFSFLLGQLLNITNVVPSCAAIINWSDGHIWSSARDYMEETQWKTSRPVVLTKFVADLEPSGIPEAFQRIDRHLNREDVQYVLISDGVQETSQVLINRLKSNQDAKNLETVQHLWYNKRALLSDQKLEMFVELSQWSDLIVFDYLIANLDRVVNNLYNYQWNQNILAAPAHNLAKQRDSRLLVFLDNESGLLHGYRLLIKYETYHNLLLDNLCVFRKSTIDALMLLHDKNPGELLNDLFRSVTSKSIRREIPPLPEKSLKILSTRIQRVLLQVRKCQKMHTLI